MTTQSSTEPRRGGSRVSQRLTGRMLLAAAVSAVSALLYGYDTGIISGALLQIKRDFTISSGFEQVIAASILFGAVLGAFGCSQLSERIGRRKTILVVAGVFVVGTLACPFSPSALALSLSRIVLAGQLAYFTALRGVFGHVPGGHGLGFMAWEPEWIPGVGWTPGQGNPNDT